MSLREIHFFRVILIALSVFAVHFVEAAGRGQILHQVVVRLSDSAREAFRDSRSRWDDHIERLTEVFRFGKDKHAVDTLKGLRYTAPAVAAAAAHDSRVPFTVETDPPNALVRVMNIPAAQKYHDGMLLEPGRYDIEVSMDGYRMRRFWIDIDRERRTVAVSLKEKGRIACAPSEPKISGNAASRTGTQVRIEQEIPGVTLDEIFFSYADAVSESGHLMAIDSGVNDGYAYFDSIQPTNLSKDDIEQGRAVDIDPQRHVRIYAGFEQTQSGVKLVEYAEIPPKAFISVGKDEDGVKDALKNGFCAGLRNL